MVMGNYESYYGKLINQKNIKGNYITMVESKITEEKLVNTKSYRDKAISRVDVLDKVKDLFLIPELEAVSMRMIADYYEVDIETIEKCYQRNKNEIDSDGVVHKKYSEMENVLLRQNVSTKICHGKLEAQLSDTVTLSIPHTGLKLFSKRAVIHFAVFLRNSQVAKQVRDYISKSNNPIYLHMLEDTKVNIHNKENKIYQILKNVFSGIADVKRQVSCGNYHIDYVINDCAIECDEYGHRDRDIKYEENREKYIKSQGYKVIRYNPDGKEPISCFINRVLINVLK